MARKIGNMAKERRKMEADLLEKYHAGHQEEEIKPAGVKGNGVYTTWNMVAGEFVVEYTGKEHR